MHPVLRGRARLANGAAGHRSTRTQRCGAGQDSHPAPCGAAAVQTPARLNPHCGATWDPALGPSWSPRPHLRPQGWRGPHPACPQPPAAVPCRASQPGATRACRHTPTTGAQEPLLAPCGGSWGGGTGAPPPPAPTAVGPSTSPSTPRHPRVPARHQRGSLRITSTPHRAAGGPPATAGEGGVPGDGRPGPRPPMHRCPPSSVPFTVTGRDGDGAGDLSEPPRALAPVPALPPGGAPSPSQHRPRPPLSLGWARTRTLPRPPAAPRAARQSSTIHSTASTCLRPARTHHGSRPLRPPAPPRGSLQKTRSKKNGSWGGRGTQAPAPSRPRTRGALAPGSEPPNPRPPPPCSACVPACLRAGASRTSAPSGPRTQNSTSTSGLGGRRGRRFLLGQKKVIA